MQGVINKGKWRVGNMRTFFTIHTDFCKSKTALIKSINFLKAYTCRQICK